MMPTEWTLSGAVVEITNRCNLRCPCCASASGLARPDEMSLDEMRGVVRDLASLGCGTFTMLGGEFLLRPDWYEIASSVREAGMELQLITKIPDGRMGFEVTSGKSSFIEPADAFTYEGSVLLGDSHVLHDS